MAYSTIARLGAEASENGENRKERAKEDCISKEARRQIASLGMIRLDTTPTVTRRGVSVAAPICSIQPPMKAKPCSPRTITPLVRVENQVPNMNVIVRTRRHSKRTRKALTSAWHG